MKMISILISILVLTAMCVGDVLGQQQERTSSGQQQERMSSGQQSGQQRDMLLKKVDDIKGSDVVNRQGQNLGKIDEVAIDLRTGRVSYAVVDTGVAGKRIPVPFSMFGVQTNGQLVLNIDKQKLDQAPTVARGSEPNWSDQNFARQVSSFWGSTPSGVMMGQSTGSQAAPMGSQGQASGQSQPMGASQR